MKTLRRLATFPFRAMNKHKIVSFIIILLLSYPLLDILGVLSLLFPRSEVMRASFTEVRDFRQIGLLAVQRVQFSKVADAVWNGKAPVNTNNVRENAMYIRRIIRGHATIYLNFSEISTRSERDGIHVQLPPLSSPEAIIDEWIFYDSDGSSQFNPRSATSKMDAEFKQALIDYANEPERRTRALEHAQELVRLLLPGETVIFDPAPDTMMDPETNSQNEVAPMELE